MKFIYMLPLILLFNSAQAQTDTVYSKSTLSHANLYYGYGAELEHTAKPVLINGIQLLIIDQVALYPDMESVQLSCPENVSILSWSHRVYTTPIENKPPASNDSIRILNRQISDIDNEISIAMEVLQKTSSLIDNNFTTPDKKNIAAAELVKLTDYYTAKVKELRRTIYSLGIKKSDLSELLTKIHNNPGVAESKYKKPETTGQLILQVMSRNSGAAEFQVSYFTRNAGWIPTYDMRIKTLDNSFRLVYKASVSQTTGLDWKNIPITISTNSPGRSGRLPVLSPVFLKLYVPQLYAVMEKAPAGLPRMEAATLDEVTMNKSVTPSNVEAYTTLKESQLNVSYIINLPYTIPSDGRPYSITIRELPLNVSYNHMAIPKVDQEVYFIANLARWDSLNLLPGDATIVMDNTYLGKSFINPDNTADTMSLSLGKDKRISIDRTVVKEFTSKAIRGDNQTDTYTYDIVIRNNKKQEASITIQDQYPVSNEKEIDIKLLEDGGANVNRETGILEWKISLRPGEIKKLRFSYQVKHPKEKRVQEHR